MIKSKVAKNATWIIACKIVQSILQFVIGMLVARYLKPSNYGLLNYAQSISMFFVPVMNLGLSNILVQEFVNSPAKEGETLGTSLLLSNISSWVCIAGIIGFSKIADAGESITQLVCFIYSISLFFQSLELTQYWFQAKYLSKYTSVIGICAYLIVSAYRVYLLVSGKSIVWFAVSYSINCLVISAATYCIYKRLGGQRLKFSKERAKALFNKSKYYIVSSLMVMIFAQTDKIMLKLMIDSTATGYYSAACTCAGLTAFVFAAIIDSFRPSIFEALKEKSVAHFELNMKRLYSIIIYLSLAQCLVTVIFARLIILIIYGNDYISGVSALQIVVWYTTFAYLGSVRNVWILANNQQKYLWIINLSGALANVGLNALLIPKWGINGAALASLITQIFTNVIIGYIIRPIRHNNTLMVQGLSPKILIDVFRTVMK